MNNNENEINSRETTKKCSKCGETKPLSEFSPHKNKKDGIDSRCRKCVREYNIKYHKDNYKIIQLQQKRKYETNKEIILANNRKIYQENKEKISIQHKEHYKLNKNRYKQYYIDNIERIIQYRENTKNYQKQYRLNNKKHLNYINNKYILKKRNTNINFRILDNIRSRLRMALKNNSKKTSSIDLLSCSIEYFKQYIENQFLPEMNWNNWGEIWELDHIIPCSKFDLSILEEQQKCFHYTNYQPLFKTTEIAESFGYTNQIGNRNKLNKIL